MNYQEIKTIESIIEDSCYDMDLIKNIEEYNARQYEVKMYNDIKETTYYLDINLCEMEMCEINPNTRKRVAYQSI
jgi:hypothetical protein